MGAKARSGRHPSTVFYLDRKWVKLVQVERRGKTCRISKLISQSVEGLTEDELISRLQTTCESEKIRVNRVLIAGPAHFSTVRVFTLPSTDPHEIKDMVELQVEKHTPYAKEEILVDYQVIATDSSGYSQVFLVIAHRSIVDRVVRIAERMRWSVDRVGFDMEGLVNWFHHSCRGAAGFEDPERGTLLVDINTDTTCVVILNQGRAFFHRSIAGGLDSLVQDIESGKANLVRELKQSMEIFEEEDLGFVVADAVLTGQAEYFPGLNGEVAGALGIKAYCVSTFQAVDIHKESAAGAALESMGSFAGLIGLGLAPSEIDLTPSAVKLRQSFEARSRALTSVGVKILVLLLLLSSLAITRMSREEKYADALIQKHGEISEPAQRLETYLAQLEIVKDHLEQRGQILQVIQELQQLTPAAVRWKELSFTKGKEVSFKASSTEMSVVFDFVSQLEKSPLFSAVEAKRVSRQRVEREDLTAFEVVCELSNAEAGG
ncbi:MAG: pilus assembly protein PilM [Candidatus Omnitrophica bacterium]|nr:pilus assembly protein PilM [Candidatus Omnitrophota bacterium]